MYYGPCENANNQRLGSAGKFQAQNRRSKRSCSNAGTLHKFHVKESQNVHDQIALYAFHSFLVEVQTNAGYICVKQVKRQPAD